MLAVAFAVTIAAFVFSTKIFGEDSVFNKAVTGNVFVNTLYNKIPALIRTVQIITIAMLLSMLLRLIMRKGFQRAAAASP